MALTKEQVIDSITVTEIGNLEIRKVTRILENGEVLGKTFSRYVIEPGDDVSSETARVRSIAAIIHTPQVIAEAQARKAARGNQ